jgi:hypothetical protein
MFYICNAFTGDCIYQYNEIKKDGRIFDKCNCKENNNLDYDCEFRKILKDEKTKKIC